MKFLKVTLAVFVATLICSTVTAFADNNYYFAGAYITGYGTEITSGTHNKIHQTNQQFRLSSCKDTAVWSDRNLVVRVVNDGTSQQTSFKEVEVGETITFTSDFVRLNNMDYHLKLRKANPLIYEAYFSGTWYLD